MLPRAQMLVSSLVLQVRRKLIAPSFIGEVEGLQNFDIVVQIKPMKPQTVDVRRPQAIVRKYPYQAGRFPEDTWGPPGVQKSEAGPG